ncbi:hypothetical protein [Vibrio lentus]|uniref:hypothetical protein n=1 Tax=Vibrio lentus TaxID=136468 RepID=UPI000C83BFA7|nr:hypothetical protein [Vibrio lentus]PMK90825.1 hypothetical protein BCT88_00925 [Vibrio lentus]
MKTFLKENLCIDLDQPSTKKGIALVGAGIALASGNPEFLTATVTDAGVQYGGLIGTVVPLAMGLWEAFRKEWD